MAEAYPKYDDLFGHEGMIISLIDWLSGGEKTEKEFDDYFMFPRGPGQATYYREGTIMLGTLNGGRRDRMLDLCQILCRRGDICARKDDRGLIIYSLPPKETTK